MHLNVNLHFILKPYSILFVGWVLIPCHCALLTAVTTQFLGGTNKIFQQ